MLFLFFIISCTAAFAQNPDKQTGIKLSNKKSTMEVVFIDRFVVSDAAKPEFLERLAINRNFIKHIPGFVEDNCYEEIGTAGERRYVTVAVWKDEEAFKNAREAVIEEYKRQGFDPAAFFKKLNLNPDRGMYKVFQE